MPIKKGINQHNQSDGNHLPIHHGFQYVGTILPHSASGFCDPAKFTVEEMAKVCFLYDDMDIVQQPVDLTTITEKLVDDAKHFIRSNQESPFYLQFSFPQTHIALFCNENFCGQSKRGIYGDNVNEMAWAVGEILDLLQELKIDQSTLSLFLSDNGPDKTGCPWGGAKGLFRGGKGTTWEGGMRVPAIALWPGTLPPGVVSESVINSVDIFPTFLHIAGGPSYTKNKNLTIDGVLIRDLLNDNPENNIDREIMFYYCSDRLMAVRYNQYKIHYVTLMNGEFTFVNPDLTPACGKFSYSLYEEYGCFGGNTELWNPPLVFDLSSDPEENFVLNATEENIQEMLVTVERLIQKYRSTIASVEPEIDKPSGEQFRPCCNPPSCNCNYH